MKQDQIWYLNKKGKNGEPVNAFRRLGEIRVQLHVVRQHLNLNKEREDEVKEEVEEIKEKST